MSDLRAIVADDDEDVLTLASRLLEAQGVSCTRASSCRDAIGVYQQDPGYHLVLTDLRQNPSGADLAGFVRKNGNGLSTRVAIMTGGASEDLTDKAKDVADFFFSKPFGIDKVKEVVDETRLYFSRVGVPGFPGNWYVDNSSDVVNILAVEGRAGDLNQVVVDFEIKNRFKVRRSVDSDGTNKRNVLNSSDIWSLRVEQDYLEADGRAYGSVVLIGLGDCVVDLMSAFIEISGIAVKQPSLDFVKNVERSQADAKKAYELFFGV